MKYSVEMSSGAMICIPSFIKIVSGIKKFMGETQVAIHIRLLSFFQNKESELLKNWC
jgi:hypothetical protein